MSRRNAESTSDLPAPLTRGRILHIVGDIDDAKVAAIERLGASLEELEEAVAWASGETDVMGEARLPLTGRVAELYDILSADDDYGDDRDNPKTDVE